MEANLNEFRLRVEAITHQFLNITTMPSNGGSILGVHHLSSGASIEPLGVESLNILMDTSTITGKLPFWDSTSIFIFKFMLGSLVHTFGPIMMYK
jgi:hypothetical protein